MRRTGEQRDPILIDAKTKLALDGMHRIKSLHSMRAKRAVCAEYDYLDDAVKLERWLRTIIAPSQKLVSMIVEEFEMRSCRSFKRAIQSVERGKERIALLSYKESFVGGNHWSVREIYRKIGEIDTFCERNRIELQFSTESDKLKMFSSESVMMIFPPKLSKTEVLSMAKQNELLPYKTTRYVVPVRPMGVHFPISRLKHSSLSECQEELDKIVNFSKVVLEKRNSWYEGRKYSERIAIFRRVS